MEKTIEKILKEYRGKLDHLDIELIIANSLAKTREFVLTHPEHKPTGAQIAKINSFAHRRGKHEPLAYILGYKEFYGLNFKVTTNTLIPRPETELLVEEAIQEVRSKQKELRIIDIGTGSGCIIISIAKEFKNISAEFYGIDISRNALQVAKKNSKTHNVEKKITFLKGNLLEPIIKTGKLSVANCQPLIILANLPYLDSEWKNLLKSTDTKGLKFEPSIALYAGKDGLDAYRKLSEQIIKLKERTKIPMTIFCEIGHTQKKEMEKIFSFADKISFKKDLSGKWRVCKIECI